MGRRDPSEWSDNKLLSKGVVRIEVQVWGILIYRLNWGWDGGMHCQV